MMKQPDWGMGTKKISQFDRPAGDTSCHKQIAVHTRELAPETDSCNRFAAGPCSLQFDMREQNSGAKVLLRSIFFSLEIVGVDDGALLRERVAGACCGSKFPRVYRPKLLFATWAASFPAPALSGVCLLCTH